MKIKLKKPGLHVKQSSDTMVIVAEGAYKRKYDVSIVKAGHQVQSVVKKCMTECSTDH
jgi:hypothetical protein